MEEIKECTVKVLRDGQTLNFTCAEGTNLMEVFSHNNVYLEAPCGGKGLCGKCKVGIISGETSPISLEEKKLLSEKEIVKNIRLACCTKVLSDLEVSVHGSSRAAQIASSGTAFEIELTPAVNKKFVALSQPNVDDQRDDLQRLACHLGLSNLRVKVQFLNKLPVILRDNNFEVTVSWCKDEILEVAKGNTENDLYGVAVDIGTTTVVCYLVNLKSGRQMDVITQLNSQKSFGSDVISRVSYTIENAEGLKRLRDLITAQIGQMIMLLADRNNISVDNIYNLVLAGNTIMMHLLAGASPASIAVSPFTPVFTQGFSAGQEDISFGISSKCSATLLPGISGYVGADITAGILASGLYKSEQLCLLIDIGTNGEIVLGNNERIVCCSTAAGPAFEGAHIKNGVGGIDGAINTVRLENGQLKYTTISHKPAIGICGSGIVDTVAVLLEAGLIDETGRFVDSDEIRDEWSHLAVNVIDMDGSYAFVIACPDDTDDGEAIVLTQKDIREVQLAKAAIAAGVKTLVRNLGVTMNGIGSLFLAGGFGSYIDKNSAVAIGLLPPEMKDRITVIGNSAGTGAIMALLSEDCRRQADIIRSRAEYIELSAEPGFQDELIECMYFE